MSLGRTLLPVGVVTAFVAGCAHGPPPKPVVWPQPPEKARIQFVKAFRSTSDLDDTAWGRFLRAFLGGSNDPMMVQPMGVALSDDGDRLYIADSGLAEVIVADFKAHRVRQFAPDEPMGKPFNVALDAEENVYVSDPASRSVHVFSRKGQKLLDIGRGDFDRPVGLTLDQVRKILYVADGSYGKSQHHCVSAYGLGGKHLFDLGPVDGPPAKGPEDGQFYFPTYLGLDGAGNVYVSDSMNFRVQEFGPNGKFIRKFGENGDAPGTFARLKGLAFDSFDDLYVVDGDHSNVQIFNTSFKLLLYFGGYARKLEYFDIPSGIAIDRKRNRIYVCNEYIARINVYDLVNTTKADTK